MRTFALVLSLALSSVASADWQVERMFPADGTIGGGDLIIIYTNFRTADDCTPFPCGFFPTVKFGDVQARSAINVDNLGAVHVITPAHARGSVPVTLQFEEEVRVVGTFTFADARDFLPLPNYEHILVPVFVSGAPAPGANGSLWTSELWVTNRGQHRVEMMHPESLCSANCAGQPFPGVEAGETRTIELPANDVNAAQLLYAQRGGIEDLVFSLRIRDISHADEHHGTEIPLVLSSEFKRHITVLNVPVDDSARTALRIYSTPTPLPAVHVRVNIYPMSGQEVLYSKIIPLPRSADPDAGGYFPYAFIADLQAEIPALANGRYRLELTSTETLLIHHLYALVSVTNNRTQLVTAIPSH